MVALNLPMVSQRTTVTGDGKPSENANQDCVAASIDALCRYLLGKPENSVFNPDDFKDKAEGQGYVGGTSAEAYIPFCASLGIRLSAVQNNDPAKLIALAHGLLAQGQASAFTIVDPYVDTNLPQYKDWTHVCVFYADEPGGLTAMDPWPAQPVYKSDSTWQSLLRSNQLWIAERIPMNTVPQGWHDENGVLTAPNGHKVVRGFREYVLASGWHPENVPLQEEVGLAQLEDSNPSLGGGTQQAFEWTVLEWTQAKGVFVMWAGRELLYIRGKVAQYYNAVKSLTAQLQGVSPDPKIAGLQSQVADLQKQLDAEKAKEQEAKAAVAAAIAPLSGLS